MKQKFTNVLFYDLETTDVDRDTCMPIQLGAKLVRYDQNMVEIAQMNFVSMMNPEGHKISPDASAVHGFLDADVAYAPFLADSVFDEFRAMANRAHYYCGHNALFFDTPIMYRVCEETIPERPTIDTLRLIQRLHPEYSGHKLMGLAYRLKLFDTTNRSLRFKAHDAKFDVELTYKLLEFIAMDLRMNIEELWVRQNTVIPSETMTFGEHKGQKISDLVVSETKLMIWYLKKKWFREERKEDYITTVKELRRVGKLPVGNW